jgi:hypothetical protein
VVAVEAK